MFNFTAIPLTPADRAEIYNHTDEICDEWRFRLSLSLPGSQAQYYNVLHRDLVKHLLDPELTLNYNDTPCVYVCEGRLRQIPREHFARALFDVIISEIPEKHWSIQIWNTSEREWHLFVCNYRIRGYELIWRTTAKDFTFNHVDISESLWLHAAQHGGLKSVNLLVDYEPEEPLKNGSYISSGATAVISSGQQVYCVRVGLAGTLIISSGGTANMPHVEEGGLLTVKSGGFVSSGGCQGRVEVYGVVREMGVQGTFIVYGEAQKCIITEHGRATIASDGVAKFCQVSAGGSATVDSGGHLLYGDVGSYGHVSAVDGSTVDNLIVSRGGFAHIYNGSDASITKRPGGQIS